MKTPIEALLAKWRKLAASEYYIQGLARAYMQERATIDQLRAEIERLKQLLEIKKPP